MNILKLQKQFETLQEKSEKVKNKMVAEINRVVKPMYKKLVDASYNISLRAMHFNEKEYGLNYFTDMDVIEIRETDDEYDHSEYFIVPAIFFKKHSSQIARSFRELKENFKIKQFEYKKIEETKWAETKRKADRREYLRLKRKFEK
jgi:hypothetical protein